MEAPIPLNPGDLLANHYRIEAEIGRGAYGRVYRARDTRLDRPVAIKELAKGIDDLGSSQFADYARRFEREARVQAGFNHPNIVHVYELIQEGPDQLYLVMEFVDGESLRDYLARRGLLPVDEAVRITSDLLAGLAVVHADPRDIVHRDVKPSNVLLTKDGHAKLADFGLAQVGDESLRFEGGKPHPGTALYMSSEQETTSAYLYPASDLFSVGCVLFEMLTGTPYKRAKKERKGLTELRPDTSPWLSEIVAAALAKDPDDRPANAAEMGRVLVQAKGKVKVEAEERTRQEAEARAAARKRAMSWLVGVGAVMALILAIWHPWTGGAPAAPAPTQVFAPIQVAAPTRTPAVVPTSEGASRPLSGVAISASNAQKVAQVARVGKGTLRSLRWTSAGDGITVQTSIGIEIHDSMTLTTVQSEDSDTYGRALSLGPDGRKWVSLGNKGQIQIWDAITKQRVLQIENFMGVAQLSVFSPDSRILAVGSANASIYLFDADSGKLLNEFRGHTAPITGITFSPDGRMLSSIASWPDESLLIWRINDQKLLHSLKLEGEWGKMPELAVFSPDGSTLFSVSASGTAQLWDLATGQAARTLERVAERDAYVSAAFSPNGRMLATGDYYLGKTPPMIRLWNVETGRLEKTLEGHTDHIWDVAFSPDGTNIASCSDDGTIRTWDVNSGKLLRMIDGYGSEIGSVAVSADGHNLAAGYWSRQVRLYNTESGDTLHVFDDPKGEIDSVAFSPAGDKLASSSTRWEARVRIWDVKTGKPIFSIAADSHVISFSRDGKFLLAGLSDGSIARWDVTSGQPLSSLQGHTGWISSLALDTTGTRAVSGGAYQDNTARLWDLTNGQQLFRLDHVDIVRAVAFNPNGNQVATACDDGQIRLWETKTGSLSRTLSGSGLHRALAYSPDGTLLASESSAPEYGSISLWDVERGQLLQKLTGHQGSVTSMVFSQDGRLLVSASSDGTVRLWKVK